MSGSSIGFGEEIKKFLKIMSSVRMLIWSAENTQIKYKYLMLPNHAFKWMKSDSYDTLKAADNVHSFKY